MHRNEESIIAFLQIEKVKVEDLLKVTHLERLLKQRILALKSLQFLLCRLDAMMGRKVDCPPEHTALLPSSSS